MQDHERQEALEELRLLGAVVGRREAVVHSRQNWLLTVLAGLSLAFLKKEPFLDAFAYRLFGLSIIIVFYLSEIIQRVPISFAIKRATEVEKQLRANTCWDGIQMSERLGAKVKWADYKFCRRPRMLAPYLIPLLIVLALSFFA